MFGREWPRHCFKEPGAFVECRAEATDGSDLPFAWQSLENEECRSLMREIEYPSHRR